MARRKYSYYAAPRRKDAGSGDRRRFSIIDWGMLIVSVVVAVAVILSWASRWIPPANYGFMSAAGLVMPVLFAANFMCLLYWAIRWRWGAFVPLAIFVFGIWGMTLFFRPQFTKSYSDTSRDRSLVSIMTYNVHGMMRNGSGAGTNSETKIRTNSSMNDVIAVVDSLRPDILCIQEFQSTRENPSSRFEDSLSSFVYKRVRFNIVSTDANHGWGNAIYSKFPIARSGHIDFEGTNNSVLWADVIVNRDTVRVFNAHLQTTSIKADDEHYIVDMDFVGDSTRNSKMRRMAGNLTHGNIIRAAQADILAADIAGSPYPVVVCGDFNDTPVSYSYHKIDRRLRDSFREAGHGYGYTYRGFFNLLRIDYILHSREMECVEYTSPSFDCSDHNPVAVKIKMP